MTAPVAAILAARASNPGLGTRKIAALVGSSDGTVRRVLHGEHKPKLPRKVLFKKVGYAGK